MGGKCSAKYGCVKDGDYCLGGLRGGDATLFRDPVFWIWWRIYIYHEQQAVKVP